VIKTSFEFALTGLSRGNITGFLTSTEDDLSLGLLQQMRYKVFDGGDGGSVERGIGDVCFQDLQVRGIPYFCGLVFRCGDEVSSVGSELEICHRTSCLMFLSFVDHFAGLLLILQT